MVRKGRGTALALVVAFAAFPGFVRAVPVGPDPSRLAKVDAKARAEAVDGLRQRLDSLLAGSGFQDARVGVHVISLRDGDELYARDADTLLNPASNIKLFTGAAALELLGPEYRFETEIWADARPDARGTIRGDLYVRGKGDPTVTSERLFRITSDLWNAGVRRVTGDIVVDDTFFDEVREGPGWDQEESDRAYIAPTGAVSLNFNAVAIHVRPGARARVRAQVSVDPESDYFVVENRVRTGTSRQLARHVVSSKGEGERQRVQVFGVQPIHRQGAVHYRRIDDPPRYFAHTLKAFLAQRGVAFEGRTRIRLQALPERGVVLLQRSYSDRLGEIVETMNKVSNNHVAEQLLKTIGAETFGAPGSWGKGVAAVEAWLNQEVGLRRGSYVMKNGSGLNDTNRFSARQITTLLAHQWRHFQVMPEFVASLAVAGRDGTARWRLDGTPAAGALRAKTGTLENVTAFSGYVATATGEVLAFAVLVNDHPGRHRAVVRGVDALAGEVASLGLPPGFQPAEPALADLGGPELDPTDIAARVRTYVRVGHAADPRNARFLASALRTEKDTLLRAVVAEALFRSDPEVGRTALLEGFEPTPELLSRLGGLAATDDDGEMEIPVITALAELAAQGDAEAIARLLATSALVEGDPTLGETFTVMMVEVARVAPWELLEGMLHVGRPAADASLRMIARGLAGEQAGRHPFSGAVSQAAARAARVAESVDDAEEARRGRRLQLISTSYEAFLDPKARAPAADEVEPADAVTDLPAPPAGSPRRTGGGG